MTVNMTHEVKVAVQRVDGFIHALPQPLCSMGEAFAAQGFPYRTIFIENDLAFPGLYLPYWIAEYSNRGRDFDKTMMDYIRECTYAALVGYLYIRIQDDIYDHKDDNDPSWLLIANEFIRECFDVYRNLFPSNAVFWNYFRQVWLDFSQATAWEIKTCRNHVHPLKDIELLLVGKKLSFAKVPITAILLIEDHETDLPIVFEIIDLLATSSQLLNDLWSLERDYKTKHYTFPLSSLLDPHDKIEDTISQNVVFEKLLQKKSIEDLFNHVLMLDRKVMMLLETYPVVDLALFIEKRIGLVENLKRQYLRMKLDALCRSSEE
ncbi:MAG: class 1 isoprenoid biosynthesis enzyme, partial [Chlamydiota bacterium]|nr:class 1 isoprenoid biosynthesis enzyme [Chlamydiota bacterium]